jgi:hypothetical protein
MSSLLRKLTELDDLNQDDEVATMLAAVGDEKVSAKTFATVLLILNCKLFTYFS